MTPKAREYYKVVRQASGNRLVSLVTPTMALEYEIGKTTRPVIPGSLIMAFTNLKDAFNFGEQCYPFRVLVGTGQRSAFQPPAVGGYDMNPLVAKAFWQKLRRNKNVGTFPVPTGTVMLNYFTPRRFAI